MSQTSENIHEATKADAEAALAETLAELGLSPDTRVAVKTVDAAATPTPPAMPDASSGDAAITASNPDGGLKMRARGRGSNKRALKRPGQGTGAVTPAPTSAPTAAPVSPEVGKVELPQEGETYRYSDPLNGVMLVTRKNGKYEVTNERGISFQIFADGLTEAEIRTQLSAATSLGKEAGVAPVRPELAPSPMSVTPDRSMDAALGAALAGGAAVAAAAAAEAPQASEGAPATPEAGPPVPGRTLEEVQDEIVRMSELTNAARKEYIRIEHEANQGWEKIKRVFRNLRGSEETSPDVLRAKEGYEEKLLALKELELEKVKLSGLRGEALRRHLAEVVVEYNFNEAERFDDDRRILRDGDKAATFKEKWDRIKENISKPERTHEGIHSLNLAVPKPTWKDWIKVGWERSKLVAGSTVALYGETTKTTKGKMISAGVGLGAGALFFTSGGAAAGIGAVLYFGRKALAGASLTMGAKAAMDAGAQWNRKRSATGEADAVASQVMGASVGEANKARIMEATTEGRPPVSFENIEISPEGLEHLAAMLKKETNWRGQAARRELWRKGRLFLAATLGAGFAGWGHWAQAGDVLKEWGILGSGATDADVREVAERGAAAASGAARAVTEAAGAPASAASAAETVARPAGAASAAQAAAESASAPAGAASAVEGGGVMSAPGTPVAPPDGGDPVPFSEGGEVRYENGWKPSDTPGVTVEGGQAPSASGAEAAPTGTAGEQVGPGRQEAVRRLTDIWEIKPGDTIGRFALTTAQDAGITDEAARRRFARLLVEHINTRLAAATGEAAEAAGFIPHPDGRFTADLIPANSELNLTQIGVTANDIERLLTQAESGVTSPATPLAEAVVSGGSETAGTATEGLRTETPALPEAPSAAEAAAPGAPAAEAATGPARVDSIGAASARAEIAARTDTDYTADETIRRRFATLEYIKSLDKTEQVQLYSSSKSLVKQLLSTADVLGENADVRYDPTSRKLGATWVARILGDYAGLRESPSYAIDTTINPLHRSQMEGVRAFALAVEETLGKEFARPAPRESIQEYVLRSVALAKMRGVTLPGMVN